MAQAKKRRALTRAQFERVVERGREEHRRGAVAVRYRPASDVLVLEMRSGVVVTLPRTLIPHLADQPKAVAAQASLSPDGVSLWFEAADLHYSVTGLIREVLGFEA
jgi:hypothetical protein